MAIWSFGFRIAEWHPKALLASFGTAVRTATSIECVCAVHIECIRKRIARQVELFFFYHHWWFGRHNENGRYAIKWPFVIFLQKTQERKLCINVDFWERNRISLFVFGALRVTFGYKQRHCVGSAERRMLDVHWLLVRWPYWPQLICKGAFFWHRATILRDYSYWFSDRLLDHWRFRWRFHRDLAGFNFKKKAGSVRKIVRDKLHT